MDGTPWMVHLIDGWCAMDSYMEYGWCADRWIVIWSMDGAQIDGWMDR